MGGRIDSLSMRERFRKALLVLAVVMPPLCAALWIFDGAGAVHREVAYYENGVMKHCLDRDASNGGRHVYWTSDGTIDRERSHRRMFGWRLRGLSEDELQDCEKWRREHDLKRMSRAVALYMNREEGLTGVPAIDNTAWARKQMAPASFDDVLAHAPSRRELLGSLVPLRDAWGRAYLLRVDSDADAPFADAVGVTVYTRGADGVPGGEGDAADEGCEHSWHGSRIVTEIP